MTTETPKTKRSLLGRILKWTGISLLVIIILLIIAPFLFKKQIVQFAKDTANKELNAKVNFGDFSLSLFRSFPDFSLSVDDLSIENVGEFEGDTLLSTKNLSIDLDLMSVIKGDKYEINSISLDQPRIHAIVLKNGKANWDITKPSADTTTQAPESEKPFKMSLKKFEIKDGYIVYNDATLGCVAELYNMDHTLKGDFTKDNFLLETLTEIERFSVTYGGIGYLNKVKTRIKCDLDADMPKSKYTFKDNEFTLNELTIGLDGFLAMPGDDMDMDLKLKANKTEFKNILSLIPGVYTKDFKDVKTSGSLTLDAFAKGIYNDKRLPAFGLKLLIQDAMFKYPSLPKSANNIQVDLLVDNKTGVTDATVIDLKKFHVDLGGNPIDAVMHVSTPVSDANIIAKIMAKINLASVRDIIPMEKGDDLNGMITADVDMKGRMSAIEKGRYDDFYAKGTLSVIDMNYKTESVPYPVHIGALYLSFNPRTVDLTKFDAKLGKSDIQMDGKIENFLQYAIKDSLLKGSFNLRSSLMDLNELMSSSEEEKPATPDTAKATVAEVPSNLDIKLDATIAKMLYENLTISNVTGGVAIKDSKLSMNNLKMAIDDLEGTMALSGFYSTQNVKRPNVDLDVNIANFDIPKTFKAFNSVQKLAPIAQFAKGKFSTDMKFAATLDEHMDPIYNTLTGGGHLKTNAVSIEGFGPINKLADALHMEKYKKIAFENIDATYEFKDGRVFVKEMPIKSGNITGTVKGSTGFDQTIDYTWNMEIPRAEFGAAANAAVGGVLDQINKSAGTNIKMSDKIKIKALFGGTIKNPTIKTDLFNTEKSAKDQVKDVVNQGVDLAKDKAREEAEKIMKDAQAQADKIKADAKILADKTKTEGYAAIDKNIEDIKNPIAKATAKVAAPTAKKEVDKKAQQIIDEANKKADDVLNKAKAESDKKLQ